MASTYDLVASEFGGGKAAIVMQSAEDMRLLKKGLRASLEAQGLIRFFYNFDAARAWAGLRENYSDPFEDAW